GKFDDLVAVIPFPGIRRETGKFLRFLQGDNPIERVLDGQLKFAHWRALLVFARKRWARLTWNAIPTRKHGCQNAFGNPAKMRFGNMLPNAFGNFRFRLLSGETAAPRMVQLLHHGWCRFWPNCTAGGDTVSRTYLKIARRSRSAINVG